MGKTSRSFIPKPFIARLIPKRLIPERLRVKSLVPKPGYTDALSTSLTIVLGPVLFGLFGRVLDGIFGSGNIFTILLAIVGLIAVATTIYYRYQAASALEDAGKPWEKRPDTDAESSPVQSEPAESSPADKSLVVQ